jgi:cytochrome b561
MICMYVCMYILPICGFILNVGEFNMIYLLTAIGLTPGGSRPHSKV